MRTLFIGAALAAAANLASAEAAAPFLGKWEVAWETNRQNYTAEMEITETGGSWQTARSSGNNPCVGRKVPLQHDGVTPNSLDMTLKFSDVIPGCSNVSVKLRLDDKGQVVGKRSGFDLKLKRE